jgi:MioC protein
MALVIYQTISNLLLKNIMLGAGAKLLCPALHIDVLNHPIPEDAAVVWLRDWLKNNEHTA